MFGMMGDSGGKWLQGGAGLPPSINFGTFEVDNSPSKRQRTGTGSFQQMQY